MNLTRQEREELKNALYTRMSDLQNYEKKYPDGGWSKESVERTKKLHDNILEKTAN